VLPLGDRELSARDVEDDRTNAAGARVEREQQRIGRAHAVALPSSALALTTFGSSSPRASAATARARRRAPFIPASSVAPPMWGRTMQFRASVSGCWLPSGVGRTTSRPAPA